MLKFAIPAVLIFGGLAATGAVLSMSGKTQAPVTLTPVSEVVLGCCGLPKPCPDCQCEDPTAPCDDGGCCGDMSACGKASEGAAAACCGGAGDDCCGVCQPEAGAPACEAAKSCAEKAETCEAVKACSQQAEAATPAAAAPKACCAERK
jgi:hypothetical protein